MKKEKNNDMHKIKVTNAHKYDIFSDNSGLWDEM